MAKAEPGSVPDLLSKFILLMAIALAIVAAIGALIGALGYAVLMAVLNLISYAWRRQGVGFEPFENEYRKTLFTVCCGLGVVGAFIFLMQLEDNDKKHDWSSANVITTSRWPDTYIPYPATTRTATVTAGRPATIPASTTIGNPTTTGRATTTKSTQSQPVSISPTTFNLSSPPTAMAGTACDPEVDTRAVDRYGWLKCEVITGISPLWMSTLPVLGYANPGDRCDSNVHGIAIAPNGDDLWCVEYANPGWKWAFVR